jgi:hypothetical protein
MFQSTHNIYTVYVSANRHRIYSLCFSQNTTYIQFNFQWTHNINIVNVSANTQHIFSLWFRQPTTYIQCCLSFNQICNWFSLLWMILAIVVCRMTIEVHVNSDKCNSKLQHFFVTCWFQVCAEVALFITIYCSVQNIYKHTVYPAVYILPFVFCGWHSG